MASSEGTERAAPTTSQAAVTATETPEDTGTLSRGSGQRGQGPEGLNNPSRTTPAEGQARLDGVRCELLMNARYHASREAFLDTVHRSLMFLIIVLGATAVADLFNSALVKAVFGACTVAFAAFDLTADLSNRARCHALMKRRYFELLADLTAGRSLMEVEEQMHRCSADEEPAFHALLAVSWNAAQEMIYGKAADAYKIPWQHRLLKNLRRYGQVKYDLIDGPRPAQAT